MPLFSWWPGVEGTTALLGASGLAEGGVPLAVTVTTSVMTATSTLVTTSSARLLLAGKGTAMALAANAARTNAECILEGRKKSQVDRLQI